MKARTNDAPFSCLMLVLWLASIPASVAFAYTGAWVPLIGAAIIFVAGCFYFKSVWIGRER